MDNDTFLVLGGLIVAYIALGYLFASLFGWFDGARRFVLVLFLGWAIIPIGVVVYTLKGIGTFFRWMFRLG